MEKLGVLEFLSISEEKKVEKLMRFVGIRLEKDGPKKEKISYVNLFILDIFTYLYRKWLGRSFNNLKKDDKDLKYSSGNQD